MAFHRPRRSELQYQYCHYEDCLVPFRGPERDLNEPFAAFVGGSEFFGKYVPTPLSDILENRLALKCVNFGAMNAGPEMISSNEDLSEIVSTAEVVVFQVTGAHNISNRFYRVHGRRNDRIVDVLPALQEVFPEGDFMDIHYTRHALSYLQSLSQSRFLIVVEELKARWIESMRDVLSRIDRPTVLFWMARHAPHTDASSMVHDPLFVDEAMLRAVADLTDEQVVCRVTPEALRLGTKGMVVPELEEAVAPHLMGPAAMREVADALTGPMRRIWDGEMSVLKQA